MKIRFDCILSSPLVRAVQTAEVFASVMKYDEEIKTAIELIGGSTYNRFHQLIKRYSHHNSLAVFGHAPDVNLYSLSLIKDNPVKDLQLNFKNASVCKVKFDPSTAEGNFEWFLNSENMKLIEKP